MSSPGRGSSFTLYLPLAYVHPRSMRRPLQTGAGELDAGAPAEDRRAPAATEQPPHVLVEPQPEPTLLANEAQDDRDAIRPGDTVLLIVENDLAFARFLLDAVREHGCKGLVTSQGAGALALARDYMPDAITLDIVLPDMDGWRVMDRLKHDLSTRHIPICVVSTEDARERALDAGARGFIAKPIPSKAVLDAGLQDLLASIRRPAKRVLVVEAEPGSLAAISQAIAGDDLIVSAQASGNAAGNHGSSRGRLHDRRQPFAPGPRGRRTRARDRAAVRPAAGHRVGSSARSGATHRREASTP